MVQPRLDVRVTGSSDPIRDALVRDVVDVAVSVAKTTSTRIESSISTAFPALKRVANTSVSML
jgi:hypothetical protein